ncbi:hypothetical protein B0J14DRAFT_230794 [Halenospora varia]|nr:hypothetical protein B0J14DRAFT_230794 [Halenospora varia]
MDPLTKLNALSGWGEEDIGSNEPAKPLHLYEGTDSDEEGGGAGAGAAERGFAGGAPPVKDFGEFAGLALGQLAEEHENFVPFAVVKKYPWTWIGKRNQKKVAERFFDGGRVCERVWDHFYIYRMKSDPNLQPILLVPTKQFEHFLKTINHALNINLTIPCDGEDRVAGFEVRFPTDGTPRPRYLGRSTTQAKADELKNNVPPSYLKALGEITTKETPSDQAIAAFETTIEIIAKAQRAKKATKKEKSQKERIQIRTSWKSSIKRTQRYLGLREETPGLHEARKDGSLEGLTWKAYDDRITEVAAKLPPLTFKPDEVAPFTQEKDVVFIAVDVEAYERNHNIITEIGIATFDTADIASVVPGEGGKNWLPLIRARHFRIKEHKSYVNAEFVRGCADGFEFGESEFISLNDAPRTVANCFKHPFSGPATKLPADQLPTRNVVLVGHDLKADVEYLRKIGYDVYNLGNLLEEVDTAKMWQWVTKDHQPMNLVRILTEFDLPRWNPHNAGNDAVYTLQAMISIAVKHLVDEAKKREKKLKETKGGITEVVAGISEVTIKHGEGWSSNGDGSDGGAPIKPATLTSKKPDPPKRVDPWNLDGAGGWPKPTPTNQPTSNAPGPAGRRKTPPLPHLRGWGQGLNSNAAAAWGAWGAYAADGPSNARGDKYHQVKPDAWGKPQKINKPKEKRGTYVIGHKLETTATAGPSNIQQASTAPGSLKTTINAWGEEEPAQDDTNSNSPDSWGVPKFKLNDPRLPSMPATSAWGQTPTAKNEMVADLWGTEDATPTQAQPQQSINTNPWGEPLPPAALPIRSTTKPVMNAWGEIIDEETLAAASKPRAPTYANVASKGNGKGKDAARGGKWDTSYAAPSFLQQHSSRQSGQAKQGGESATARGHVRAESETSDLIDLRSIAPDEKGKKESEAKKRRVLEKESLGTIGNAFRDGEGEFGRELVFEDAGPRDGW